MTTRVTIIGHFALDSGPIRLPPQKRWAQNLIKLHNYTRIVTDDGHLVDHLSYLKQLRGADQDETYSIWEIYLTSGVLLASHLKRQGFETQLINYVDDANAQEQFNAIREFAPDVTVLSTTFVLTKAQFLQTTERVRAELPSSYLVAGGHHVFTTLMYMSPKEQIDYLEKSGIDAFINDTQGETAILQLCQGFGKPGGLDTVPNLTWRSGPTVKQNPALPESNDINATVLDFDQVPPGSIVHMRTARSCSFKCAFCTYPSIAGPLALMEVDNAIATLKRAKERDVRAIFFADDTFNVPPERFEAILDGMIANDINIPWYSFLRCQYVTESLVQKMKRSGCAGVFLGIESGSDKILKNMKKGAITRFYRDGIKWLRENEIAAVGAFVVGFPGETDETVAETQTFIEESGLEYYFMQPFYYIHHAPIHKRAEKYGLTGNGLYWSHATMDWRQAVHHVNRLFVEIKSATFVNPDFNLWEYAYLRSKGISSEEYKQYRHTINKKTVEQMLTYGITLNAPSTDSPMSTISRGEA